MSFKFVHNTQNYITKIAHSETRPPNYWVSEDALTYVVGRSSLTIDALRSGIQAAYRELWSLYAELVGDRRVTTPLTDVVDDISNTTRGYSFSSEPPFAARKHDCFLHVVKTKKLAAVDANGNFAWNKPATTQWLLTAAKFWRVLGWTLSITCQISTRLTQFMETTLINADHLRSLLVQGGEMLLLGRNHKAGHITERDACTPGFVPKPLAEIIFEALTGGLRETEAIFIHFEHGPEAAEIHRT